MRCKRCDGEGYDSRGLCKRCEGLGYYRFSWLLFRLAVWLVAIGGCLWLWHWAWQLVPVLLRKLETL